jgi:tetratricopeptide (TPR) repeat protein
MDDAARAYSRALDLDPNRALAVVGRAEAYCPLDLAELALADYDRALAIEPQQPLVLAALAILHYEAGRLRNSAAWSSSHCRRRRPSRWPVALPA